MHMHRHRILVVLLLCMATACSQRDKKPRLAQAAVVGTWTSDTTAPEATVAVRAYELRMSSQGMAEFKRLLVSGDSTVERGTWDGADSLIRLVVHRSDSSARSRSLLFAMRPGSTLGLVQFDSTVWGAGLTLRRK
jgi:hypothetical protein